MVFSDVAILTLHSQSVLILYQKMILNILILKLTTVNNAWPAWSFLWLIFINLFKDHRITSICKRVSYFTILNNTIYLLASIFWLKNATFFSETNFSNFNKNVSSSPFVVLNSLSNCTFSTVNVAFASFLVLSLVWNFNR